MQFVFQIIERGTFLLHSRLARGKGTFQLGQLRLLFRDKGEIVVRVAVRDKAVDDRSGIFPFGQILFRDRPSRVGEGEIFSSAAVGEIPVIRLYVFERLQTFERAVKSGLFQRVKPAAFLFYLVDDIVPVFVAVV